MPQDSRLVCERFPRSSQYHPEWIMASVSGGANALWLTEWLTSALQSTHPGAEVSSFVATPVGTGLMARSYRLRLEGNAGVPASIVAKVYRDASWMDGKETIVIDYSRTSFFAKKIRDEIREVEPGVYLGKVWWGKTRILDFALSRPA